MRIERFRENSATRWDEFVEQSPDGTLMHQRRFLAYHPPEKFVDHSVWIQNDDDSLVAVLPAAEVTREGRRLWVSHPGASYGGPVFCETASVEDVDRAVGLMCGYAREQDFSGMRMRLTEGSLNTAARAGLDAALFRYDFVQTARELSSVVPLTERTDSEPYEGLSPSTAHSVRKALRDNVVTRPSDDFAAYWSMLESNLNQRHGVKPTHTLAEIDRLRAILGDRIQLVAAFADDRMIAGTVVFYLNRRAAYTMYMSQNYEFKRLRPLNLVLFQAVAECRRRGVSYLCYGVSTEPGSDGREVNWGLYQYKRQNGAEAAVRDTWFKALV